ncbi:MAG: lamin tail domain-containing protein [Sedimentisphaerales bacterium]|nr:lamin tail domain-containing protein [Sedimentisphaerales bacterium]
MLLPAKKSLLCLGIPLFLAIIACAEYYPIGDLDGGRDIDMDDLRLFAQSWLSPGCVDPGCEADLDGRNGINLVDFALLARNWGGIAIITEFMASNHSVEPLGPGELLDEDKESSDWIEIHNPTDTPVNLNGWYLTHDPCDLTEWEFPAVELGPGEFRIVFASDKNRRNPAGTLHTNFNLDANGDYLAIVRPDGKTIVHEYWPKYPGQFSDISYGLAQYAELIVQSQAEVSYHVPTASDASIKWTAVGYNDGSWNTAETGLGFGLVQADLGDVTFPGDAVQGVPNNTNWPAAETPPMAIDDTVTTKYLHFEGPGTGFQVTPSVGKTVVTGLTFTTANDAPGRDPIAYALYGSNVSIDGPYTPIATGQIVDFRQATEWPRFTKNVTPISFANSTGYDHYQLIFTAVRTAGNYVQIADVEFLGRPAGSITSDIEEQMLNINASLWVRAKFSLTAEDIEAFDILTLNMIYEDGYVAYLNGEEVARSNFSGAPMWNSHADSNRPNDFATEFEAVGISGCMDLLQEGTNVLAIQALNDSAADGLFWILPELMVASEVSVQQYFTTATPGEYNTSGAVDVVADTTFSHDRGFYDAPFSVTITTDTEEAIIHYTIDGSTPSETYGTEYVGPIDITTTTCLRAMAFKAGYMSTNVDTHTYIFLDDVINQPAYPTGFPTTWSGTAADYQMDPDIVNNPLYQDLMYESLISLPSLSIVTDMDNMFGSGGIYSNPVSEGYAWERPVSMEWINTDGSTAFHLNCGMRVYGGAFRRMDLTRKKSFRILFKREYGTTKLRYPLFGEDAADEFDTIILRGGANDGWNNWGGGNTQYIVDEFIRRTQLAFGQPAVHGTFVHLYINGLYWGLYNPVERPDRSFGATYFGGNKEEWDAIHESSAVSGSSTTTWNSMLSLVRGGMTNNASYQRIQGNNLDGTDNPSYDDLLDVDNYIDYLSSNFYGGTSDWGGRNWYVACRRPPDATGFKFFSWDAEGAIVVWSSLTTDVTGRGETIQEPYTYLKQNAEFRMLFGDHVHRQMFNDGPGTAARSYERYKELADEIELAIIAESARWGDQATTSPYTLATWQSTCDYVLNTYMPQRSAIVLNQLRNAGLYPDLESPEVHVNGSYKNGGEILPTDQISMVLSADITYIDTELVVEGASARAHVPVDDSLGLTWTTRSFVPDADWTDGTTGTGVGYETGSDYRYWIDTDVRSEMYNRSTSVFVRIAFDWDGSDEFDKLELQMRYDDGFIAYLNGTRVCTSGNVTNEIPGTATAGNHEAVSAYETFDITDFMDELTVGSNLLAIHGINITTGSSDMIVMPRLMGKIIDDTSLSLPIMYTTDGSDPRLLWGGTNPHAIEYAGPFTLSGSTIVKARTFYNSQWSALNETLFGVGPVADSLRITEVMFHPQNTGDPNEEYIELKNMGTAAINLNMVKFADGVDFTFQSWSLDAGQYVLVVRDQAAFAARYPEVPFNIIAGQYTGSLDNGGERIKLIDAIGQTIHNFKYLDGWFNITDGMGFSLTIKDPDNPDPNEWGSKSGWRTSVFSGGSPGWDDSGTIPEPGTIVINEVLAHSHDDVSDWIELYNTSNQIVDIGGWFLSDSDSNLTKYEIAEETYLDPCDYIVFHQDPNFGVVTDPGTHEPFAISENGETIYLHAGRDGDLMGFMDQETFDASETGVAFGRYRKSTGTYNFAPMEHNTPGWENEYPKVGPVVITELMYHPTDPCEGDPPAYEDDDFEYIEIYNITGSTVSLEQYDNEASVYVPWQIEGVGFTFPPNTTIPAYGYLVIARNTAAFEHRYGSLPAGMLLGPCGKMENGGERIQLSKPGDENLDTPEAGDYHLIRVDRVNYSDGSHDEDFPELPGGDPWPIGPDGWGYSLTKTWPSLYGNDPNNWTAQIPSPGE